MDSRMRLLRPRPLTAGCSCGLLDMAAPSHWLVVGFLGASIVLAILVFAVLIVLIVPLLGLVWAPFAAWLCARSARARGLDSRKFAVAGVVYSALLFWPSIYPLLRTRGKRVSGRAVHTVYVVLYGVVWPASCLAIMLVTIATPRWFVMLGLSLGLCNAVTWLLSHRRLARWHGRHGNPQAEGMDEILPNRASDALRPYARLGLTRRGSMGTGHFHGTEGLPSPEILRGASIFEGGSKL